MILGRLPRIEHVWVALLLASVAAAAGLLPLAPWDLWWHAAVGREIIATGTIPTSDHFSYTAAGQPYHYQNWLGEIVLYAVLRLKGPAGAVWLRMAVLLALFKTLLWVSFQASEGRLRLAVAATGVAAVGSATNWAVRPQLLSLVLFVAELALLWRWRSAVTCTTALDSPTSVFRAADSTARGPLAKGVSLWPLPLILAAWANVHGAFILGLALPALLWAGELLQQRRLTPALRQLAGWSALAALATLLNPRGLAIVPTVIGLMADSSVRAFASEWRAPTLGTTDGRLFFACLAGSAALFVWRWRSLRISDWLWWLGFAALATTAIRHVIWFFLLLAPLLARALAGFALQGGRTVAGRSNEARGQWQSPGRWAGWVNAGLIAALALLALVATPPFKDRLPLPAALRGLVTTDTPIAAVQVLEQRLPRHLFHDMGHGSYLIWRWHGTPPVFIDPRFELYPFDHWNDYGTVIAARPGWQAILDRWEVETLLLDRGRQAPLVDAALAAGWQERWGDDATIILDREAGR
ncbi:MAG TPA: hypothetical protein VER55_05090 [Ardenticatenaceae bacterium]|nr:hypothetical protein [Ardenticatenaceae bacterium]